MMDRLWLRQSHDAIARHKILFVGRSELTSYGGIQSFLLSLSEQLHRRNCSCWYLQLPRFADVAMKVFRYCNTSWEMRTYPARSPVGDVITDIDPDIVHSHNPQAALVVHNALRNTSIGHLVTIHDVAQQGHSIIALRAIERAAIVTQSAYNQLLLEATFGSSVTVLPVGIDFQVFKTAAMPDQNTIAFPGRLCFEKGALLAVRILGALATESGPLHLVLSDKERGSFGQTTAYVQTIKDAVAQYRDVTYEHNTSSIYDLYSRSMVTLLLPLLPEGFGLAALESLAMGRPVVVMPTGGMAEWLDGLPGVIRLRSNEISEACTGLKEVLSNWQYWHNEALLARAELERRYGIEAVSVRYVDTYTALRAAGRPIER